MLLGHLDDHLRQNSISILHIFQASGTFKYNNIPKNNNNKGRKEGQTGRRDRRSEKGGRLGRRGD